MVEKSHSQKARAYMRAHDGVTYQQALEAVRLTLDGGFDWFEVLLVSEISPPTILWQRGRLTNTPTT